MIGPQPGSAVTNRDLEWTHYPENDFVPEHFSCVYGLVIHIPGTSRWEAWTLSTIERMPVNAEDIQLGQMLGSNYSAIQTAKRAVLGYVEQYCPKGKAVAA